MAINFEGFGVGAKVVAPGCKWLTGKVVRRFERGGIEFVTLKFGSGRETTKRTFTLNELQADRKRRLGFRESKRVREKRLRAERKATRKQGGQANGAQ